MEWKDITVEQFYAIKNVNESLDEFDRAIVVCSILFPEVEFSLDMPYKDLMNYIAQASFLGTQIPKVKLQKKYKTEDFELKIFDKVNEISTSQYMDYQNFVKQGKEIEAVCVFLVPVGKEYNKGYDFEKVVEQVKQMKVTDFFAINFFLQNRWVKYIKTLLNSLIRKAGKMIVKENWRRLWHRTK